MTYEMAVHLGPHHIRVISLQPGAIDTEISRKYSGTFSEGAQKIADFSIDMTPLGRWGRPEEMGKIIRFLASDDASFITNTTILADGGWLRQTFPRSLSGPDA
jgi:NAD(P)-dependent dehydrogenase (short-subunit alcohol dehydrogenase family)